METNTKDSTRLEVPSSRLSARRERFCQLHASGKSAAEAYREVYGNSNTAKAAASRLLTFVDVQKRIKALQDASATDAVMTLRLKREFLCRVVLTPIGEVDRNSDLCQRYVCRVQRSRHAKQAQRGVGKEDEDLKQGHYLVGITMPDKKLRAIELDAKLAGELPGKHEEEPEVDNGMVELLARIGRGDSRG